MPYRGRYKKGRSSRGPYERAHRQAFSPIVAGAATWAGIMGVETANENPILKNRSPAVVAKVLNKLLDQSTAVQANHLAGGAITTYGAALQAFGSTVGATDGGASIVPLFSQAAFGAGDAASLVVTADLYRSTTTSAGMRTWEDARETYRAWLFGLAAAAGVPSTAAVDHLESVTVGLTVSGSPLRGTTDKKLVDASLIIAAGSIATRLMAAKRILPKAFPRGLPRSLDAGQMGYSIV